MAIKYFLFDDIQYDGGSLEEFDTLEEAKKNINSDSEMIIKGEVVWTVDMPTEFPAVLRIGKFYETREGHKALLAWIINGNEREYLTDEQNKQIKTELAFVDQSNGSIIRTFWNGRYLNNRQSPKDIIGDWEKDDL